VRESLAVVAAAVAAVLRMDVMMGAGDGFYVGVLDWYVLMP